MEGNKGGGGGGRVGVGDDDMGDGMQCMNHPYRNNPSGICAICLQEKLAKLVSSSFPLPIRASPSSSSSPSFRSNNIAASSTTIRPCAASITATATSAASASSSLHTLSVCPTSAQKNGSESNDGHHYHEYYTRRVHIPFLLTKKKKKASSGASATSDNIILKRSKSSVTPRRNHSLVDADEDRVNDDFSPRKRNGFWSFLYLSSKSSTKKLKSKSFRDPTRISTINATSKPKEKSSALGRNRDIVVEEDNSTPNSNTTTASASSFERKISRSRSVGCGSRSFSGDFFERISTGFGDCTLRRVESQREGKSKVAGSGPGPGPGPGGAAMNRDHCMKERVRCGGLFSGFMMTSSSSSSSSSHSSYWVSSSADDTMNNGKSSSVALSHGRGRSWGWAFASPMRAFTNKPSSKDNRRNIIRDANDKNATPNLSAIPSLLAVRG